MKIKYAISDEDYLQYLLFTASESREIKIKRMKSWLIVPVIYIIIAVVFFFLYDGFFNYYVLAFTAIALVWLAVYPRYQKRLYVRHYRKYVNKNYLHRTGRINVVELKGKNLYVNDGVNESRFALSEFVSISETRDYIFPMMKSNLGMIIPKREVNKKELVKFVKAFSKSTGLKVKDKFDWKWK